MSVFEETTDLPIVHRRQDVALFRKFEDCELSDKVLYPRIAISGSCSASFYVHFLFVLLDRAMGTWRDL